MKYRFILPSVLYLTLGETNSCRVSYRGHSATSPTSPTAQYRAVMKHKKNNAECPRSWHTAKYRFILPSVLYLTLGEKNGCRVSYKGHSVTSSTGPTAQYRPVMKH